MMWHGWHRRPYWSRWAGCPPFPHGRGYGREARIRALEEYQRDLEQRAADVADLVARLKGTRASATGEA